MVPAERQATPSSKDEQVITLHRQGLSQRQIAKVIGVSQVMIHKRLRRLGRLGLLPSRPEGPALASCEGGTDNPRDVSPSSPNAAISGDVPRETDNHFDAQATGEDQVSGSNSYVPTRHERAESLANLDRAPASPAPERATPRIADNQHVAPPALDTLTTANAGSGTGNPTSDNQQSTLPATDNLPVATAPDSSRAPTPVYPRVHAKAWRCEWCRGWFVSARYGQRFCCNICGIKGAGQQPAVPKAHSEDCPLLRR
jgi:hypothetical protein